MELVKIKGASGAVYLCVVKTMVTDASNGYGMVECKAEEVCGCMDAGMLASLWLCEMGCQAGCIAAGHAD